MSIKKISICVLTSLLCLSFAGAVFAADFDHSMKFTNAEINAASVVLPMSAATNATDVGDSMTFTSAEIDIISLMDSLMYTTANSANLGDSMTFTSAEIDSIGVPCTQYC